MASKANKTDAEVVVVVVDTQAIVGLVADTLEYQRLGMKLDWLREREKTILEERGSTAKRMIKVMQDFSHHPWEALKKPIRVALVGAGAKNIDGWMGVYKTAFEKRVLPEHGNADKFRKQEHWVGWTGQRVKNPECKKPTPPTATTSSTAPPTASTPPTATASTPPTATASTPPTATATTASTATTAPKAIVGDADKIASKASDKVANKGDEVLLPLELWATCHVQWARNPLTSFYLDEVAGVLGIDKSKLLTALNVGEQNLRARIDKASKK